MKALFVGCVWVALPIMMAAAGEVRFQSGPQQTALVELYTSEGCSSCPPAEAWLSRRKGDPGLWNKFVPIAFHVDYWDRLGWRDRFSSKEWTARQSRYAALWQTGSVYTPAVVLNGKELRSWSSADLSSPNDKGAGLLVAKTADGKNFTIEFRPATAVSANWDAHLALLGSGISSKVRAGENSGRNLMHDFVALALRDAPMRGDGETKHADLPVPATNELGARLAVAIWVSARDQLTPWQATGGWLP